MSEAVAIELNGVQKSYGDVIALDRVSLSVPEGQSCAVIGPNGAGKTTLVEIVVNLRKVDLGTVKVDGLDVARDPNIVSRLGVQLQEATLFPRIKAGDYVHLFGQLYGIARDPGDLLADLGLTKHLNKNFGDLSGGLKQRLLLALALINDPKILILDEPTTGLDPIAREELWSYVEDWRTGDRTLLLTSHFMDEVERLCERVVVLSGGRIVADGDVDSLLLGMPPEVKTLQAAYGHLVMATSK